MIVPLLNRAICRKTNILYLGAGTIFHITKIKLAEKQQQAESSDKLWQHFLQHHGVMYKFTFPMHTNIVLDIHS